MGTSDQIKLHQTLTIAYPVAHDNCDQTIQKASFVIGLAVAGLDDQLLQSLRHTERATILPHDELQGPRFGLAGAEASCCHE